MGRKRHTAESWNAVCPVGTRVRFYPVLPPSRDYPPIETTTRSEAWTLGDGTVVVALTGRAGGCAISHVEVTP